MATYTCSSFKQLEAMLRRHNKSREKRVQAALVRAVRKGRAYIVSTTLPIAFRELEKSLKVVKLPHGVALRADAPHAAAVETGSRPHWPPLAPLIAWVKLRGKQGLSKRRPRGTTSGAQAQGIGGMLKAMQKGGALDVDAPEQIARAIQVGIAKHGTKPHWYMRQALPMIDSILDVEVRIAMEDRGQGTGIA